MSLNGNIDFGNELALRELRFPDFISNIFESSMFTATQEGFNLISHL